MINDFKIFDVFWSKITVSFFVFLRFYNRKFFEQLAANEEHYMKQKEAQDKKIKDLEEIERKKAINQMAKLQNLTNRKKAQRRQIRKEEENIMYQYLSAEYCPF